MSSSTGKAETTACCREGIRPGRVRESAQAGYACHAGILRELPSTQRHQPAGRTHAALLQASIRLIVKMAVMRQAASDHTQSALGTAQQALTCAADWRHRPPSACRAAHVFPRLSRTPYARAVPQPAACSAPCVSHAQCCGGQRAHSRIALRCTAAMKSPLGGSARQKAHLGPPIRQNAMPSECRPGGCLTKPHYSLALARSNPTYPRS